IHPNFSDSTKIKWSSSLTSRFGRNDKILFRVDATVQSLYRPFTKQHAYFDSALNHRVSQLPKMFPTPQHNNFGIIVSATAERAPFSILVSNKIIDLNIYGVPGQFFPRFTWEEIAPSNGGLFAETGAGANDSAQKDSIYGDVGEEIDGYRRVDNLTDEIKKLYRDAL